MKGFPPLARWISSAASSAEADSDVFATRRNVPEALSGSSFERVVDGWRAISSEQLRSPLRWDGAAGEYDRHRKIADPVGHVEKQPETLLIRQVRIVDQEDER